MCVIFVLSKFESIHTCTFFHDRNSLEAKERETFPLFCLFYSWKQLQTQLTCLFTWQQFALFGLCFYSCLFYFVLQLQGECNCFTWRFTSNNSSAEPEWVCELLRGAVPACSPFLGMRGEDVWFSRRKIGSPSPSFAQRLWSIMAMLNVRILLPYQSFFFFSEIKTKIKTVDNQKICFYLIQQASSWTLLAMVIFISSSSSSSSRTKSNLACKWGGRVDWNHPKRHWKDSQACRTERVARRSQKPSTRRPSPLVSLGSCARCGWKARPRRHWGHFPGRLLFPSLIDHLFMPRVQHSVEILQEGKRCRVRIMS